MPQVLNSENLIESITTGKVPEFKPPTAAAPEAPKPEVKPTDSPVATPAVTTAAETKTVETPPRGEDGKFVKADQTADAAAKAADDGKKADADDDVVLTKKIERLINKKHRAMIEAEEFATGEARRAIAAEQRAADLQRQIDELRGTKSGSETRGAGPAGDEPKPEDFNTVGEYTRALVKYEAKQAGKSAAQNAEVSRQQAQANEVIGQFVERQKSFKKATPDYEEALEAADFEIPNIAQQYLVESEFGPQLAYHLAKNPDVAASLRKLSPARVIAQLGKLETQFEKPVEPAKSAAPAANGVSKAPAPIQPLEAKSTPVQKDPSQMNFQELRAYRQAQAQAKRA